MSTSPNFSEIPRTTLGLFIREKRMALGKTLRGFAAELNKAIKANASSSDSGCETTFSAGFLSDIENSRRFPSEKWMPIIAKALGVSVEDLRASDQRMPTDDLQKLQTLNPMYGFAFRKAVSYIQEQNLTPEEVVKRFCSDPNEDL